MPTIKQVLKKKRKKKYCSKPARQLVGCPHKHGVISKVRVVAPKKPNSARRKIARVKLSTGKMVTARLIGQGHNLQSYSHVLIRGGRANDLPGVRYTMIKGALDFS
jgi:small subunit ribosomal protein S12